MQTKLLEIRDRGTCIGAMAIQMSPSSPGFYNTERKILEHCGWSPNGDHVTLVIISGGVQRAFSDPYDWNDRTMKTAHEYIRGNFNSLSVGQIVDVEYILGEVEHPKTVKEMS